MTIQAQRENHQSIYVLLFLNVVFFFLQFRDAERYQFLFALDPARVAAGELWRLVTFNFLAPGSFWFFLNMLVLYIVGSALEEVWGTWRFVTFLLCSVAGAAAVAMFFGFTLLSASALNLAILFAFAKLFPEHVFYVFFVLPVKVKWLAFIAAASLLVGVANNSTASMAALGGVILAMGYDSLFLSTHWTPEVADERPPLQEQGKSTEDRVTHRNLVRFARMREALGSGNREKVDALIREIQPDIVPGVNICPPADYKPEKEDRYCVRCEGFAECSVRYLRSKELAAPPVVSSPAASEPDPAG